MTRYYTYEYGWVDADEAVHVYRSKDKMIGLKVRRQRNEGVWSEGYSRSLSGPKKGASSSSTMRHWPAYTSATPAMRRCRPGIADRWLSTMWMMSSVPKPV